MDFVSAQHAREAMEMAKSGRYQIGGGTITNANWARVLDKPLEPDQIADNSEVITFILYDLQLE